MNPDILQQLRFADFRHSDTPANDNDIRVSGFVFCAVFMAVGCFVFLGAFFLGAHAARGLLGAWGAGL